MRICAVLGSPIGHSLSPALHRAAYAELGLDWDYQRHEVVADELAGFVAGCDASWRGLSCTMPLKEAVLDLGEVDPLAALVGAGNTLVFGDDGVRRVYNTDVDGLVRALTAAGVATGIEHAVLLGSGATARSTLASLSRCGVRRVTVVARNPDKAEALRPLAQAVDLDLRVSPWGTAIPPADLAVSTTTAGATDEIAADVVARVPAVFDVIYHPWPTRLADLAQHSRRTVLNGLDLLVHQAVIQVELMTGSTVDPTVLRSAGQAALSTRGPA